MDSRGVKEIVVVEDKKVEAGKSAGRLQGEIRMQERGEKTESRRWRVVGECWSCVRCWGWQGEESMGG